MSERNRIGTTKMQEESEGIDTDATCNCGIALTVHATGSDDDIGHSEFLPILRNNFLLLQLPVAVGFPPEFRSILNWARLVQESPLGLLAVRVDRERAHEDESPQQSVLQTGFEQIACSDNGVQAHVGKRFLPCSGSQMIDEGYVSAGSHAIL